MSDKNRFANLHDELTSDDISANIMEAIKKLGEKQASDHKQLIEKQASDHKQLMDKLNTLEGIKEKVDVLEENYQNLLPLVSKVAQLESKFSGFSKTIDSQRKENIELVKKIEGNTSEIKWLKLKLDDKEQHNRNECVRMIGIQIDKDDEKALGHNQAAIKAVEEVLKPLLDANKDKLKMPTGPGQYIKNAHILPIPKQAKAGDYKSPPIIVRFHSRPLKDFILSNKNDIRVRDIDCTSGVNRYSISADLTKMRYNAMQVLIKSKKFFKCWHIDGRVIKYIKKHGDNVQSVKFFEQSHNDLLSN